MNNQENIAQKYIQDVCQVFENNMKIQSNQLETIKEMNIISLVQYSKNLEKINQINEEYNQTNINQQKLLEHFSQIDQIEQQIEGMESSVEYLDIILDRIENKLQDLEKIDFNKS